MLEHPVKTEQINFVTQCKTIVDMQTMVRPLTMSKLEVHFIKEFSHFGGWNLMNEIAKELNLTYPNIVWKMLSCDCNRKFSTGIRYVIVHVKEECNCENWYNHIHVWSPIDISRMLPVVDRSKAIVVQTFHQKKWFDQNYNQTKTVVIPHHIGRTIRSLIENRKLIRDDHFSRETFRIGAHARNHREELKNVSIPGVETRLFTFDENGESTESIHKKIASLDVGVIWSKLDDRPQKPWQRASNHASSGIPIILHGGLPAHHEFARLRLDLAPYPYVVNNISELKEAVVKLKSNEIIWKEARKHAMEIAKCNDANIVAKQWYILIQYLIAES